MQILSVDTSGAEFSVALGEGSTLLEAVVRPSLKTAAPGSGSSAQLIPTIGDLLKRHRRPLSELDGIVTTVGPGSFTGLRVGLMTVKTLAWAAGIPLVGLTTIEVLARQAERGPAGQTRTGRIGVVLNAQRGQLFAAWYRKSGTGLQEEGPIFLAQPDEFISQCRPEDWLTGSGLPLCQSALGTAPLPHRTDRSDWTPQPQTMLEMGVAQLQKQGGDDLWRLQPLYFRPSAAEEKRRSTPPPAAGK